MTRRLSIAVNIALAALMAWYFLVHRDIRSYWERYFDPQEDFLEDIYYRAKVDSYAGLNSIAAGKRVVFAGDSMAEQFPAAELFPGSGALNRGVGKDTSRGVLERLEASINGLAISRFYLIVGHNDTKYRSVEETAQNISLIFSRVRADEKFFVSVLPTADPGRDALIRRLNEAVKKEASKGGFIFVDLYGRFLKADGSFNDALFYDGVHPNLKGHRVLAEGLAESLGQGR